MLARTPLLVALSVFVSWPASAAEPRTPKDLAPRTFTHQGDTTLSKALAELARQTGNTVEDRRHDGTDPSFKLDVKSATFWQALEAIARAADVRISLYQRDGKVAVVSGPYREVPVSFHGLFRISVRRVTAFRDLETGAQAYVASLVIAWEPRFHAFLVETNPEQLVVEDDKGHRLTLPDEGKGQASAAGKNALEVDVRLPAPPRAAKALTLFKGSLSVTGPSKMLTFLFDKLAKGEKKTQEGITVALSDLTTEEDRWTVRVGLDYPAGGPEFESFQSWLVYNQIHLEKKGGTTFPANGGFATVSQESNRAEVDYNFVEDGKRKLGKAGDWKVVYRTPGRIIQVAVPFEFKDVPLP
jgi:hypothetical protein